jgi:fructokinase
MDRVSGAALILAKTFIERGALVFFEPSGFGATHLFKEAYGIAHIVKYSHERAKSFHGAVEGKGPLLEIETLGDEGLRYRNRICSVLSDGWKCLDACEVAELRDAAGAGDWCSAGIIHRLAYRGLRGFLQANDSQVKDALRFGQALAAWNCAYAGARGGMYAVDKKTFRLQVQGIISKDGSKVPRQEVPNAVVRKTFECICPRCAPAPTNKQK